MDNITAKDLMIGDIVDVHRSECVADGGHYMEWNEYGKVVSITEDYITIKYNGREDDYGFEDVEEKDINPIPLTSDILEKNGFVKSYGVSDTPPYDTDEEGNMYYSFKGEHKFWGWWQPDNTYYIPANAMGDIVIKYVHQLQHALRLAGIDKEIELWEVIIKRISNRISTPLRGGCSQSSSKTTKVTAPKSATSAMPMA